MSVRSRAAVPAAPPGAQVAKAYGNAMPPAMAAAEERARMTPASPFSPGPPLGPYEGYDRTPRATPFVTGYNIATRPRTHERVSFETLKGLIDAYDIAQICLNHRIDGIRALDWKLVAADHFTGDPADYITLGMKALDKPDRVHYWETWLGKWLWDELAYGCGPLYRLRNRAGRCIGLLPVDCITIAPLLDYWGLPPGAMEQGTIPDADLPVSHVQYVNGIPWNWLTRADLIYEPFRLHNDSPYGRAPIESIILNANTDVRFQLFFLQTFTEGNLPAAFASSPETWTPDQIEQFQEYWDGIMYGDQARKHQIRWMPPGTKFAWSNEKEFKDSFSLFLMRKTAAAFHVVPTDIGFTENSNYSTGESQADVAHRIGDLPFIRYVQRILTSFLQNDLRLPLKFTFDLGEEQADRAEQANADKIYVDMGAVGVSELREMRYGLTDPVPVPRYIFTERAGPIPVASLLAVAGEIDPATGLPVPGAPLPKEVFGGTEGVLPNPPIKVMSLAEREFGPKAMPPAPPPQPVLQPGQVGESEAPVAKEGDGTPAAGITAETGIYSYDLQGPGDEDEDDNPHAPHVVAKARARNELAAFRRFCRARRKAGEWRDFEFTCHSPSEARELNRSGAVSVAKAAGEVAVAGLAVLARDTGRVLMLQRALNEGDPASGRLEFPGGHLEQGESPLQGAWREWCEECGIAPPPGEVAGEWTAGDGIYRGIVWAAESESSVPVRGASLIPNPDDPDHAEAIMWVDPADLAGNPMVRDELAASLPDVLPLLGVAAGGCCGAACCSGDPGCCGGDGGCGCGTEVAFRTLSGTCECCGGAGEHPTGHECYRCDASGDPDSADAPFCDEVFRDPALHAQGCPNCGPADITKAGDGSAPKALSAPEDWPGWQRDLKLSGIYAGRLREALKDAVDTRALARDWVAQHPPAPAGQVTKALPGSVTAFLAGTRAAIEGALRKVLPSARAEGWVLGQQSAQASAAAAAAPTPAEASAALGAVDWAGWQPGDPEAAYQVAGTGLRDLLASQDVQIKSIASSRLEELGDVLAEHLSSPETSGPVTYSVDSLAASLEDVLDNPARAEMVAVTEIARAQSAAASWVFQQMGVSLVRVSTAGDRRVCPRCLAAEAAGAQPIGTYSLPIHPSCRCAMCGASPPLTPLASLAGFLGAGGS